MTPEFARKNTSYADLLMNMELERNLLANHRSSIINNITFVLSTTNPLTVVAMFDMFPMVLFLADMQNRTKRLLALARVTYQNWPSVVNVDRIGSLVKGGCKKISSELAKLFLSQKTNTVNIESINNSAHMCYLKSYLPFYRYGILTATTNSNFSALVDQSTFDIWLMRYGNTADLKHVTIYGTVYMKYIKDDDTLLTVKKGIFAQYSHSALEIYCQVTEGVAAFIDHFVAIGEKGGNDWSGRVFVIARPAEFRAKFPHKRQKLAEDEDDE